MHCVADLDVCCVCADDLVANCKTEGCDDITLFAVCVVKKCDVC